ncbi:MAG: ABC transporter ATP-binding protein [Bacillota bacterium]
MVKKLIKGFIKQHLWYYILGIIALVASGVLQLTIPKLLGHIIDLLTLRSAALARISWLTAGMLGLAVAVFGLKFCWRYLIVGRSRDLECFLRDRLFSHLQSLPVKFYNTHKTGDLMAYATNDLGAIRRAFAFGLVFMIDGVIMNSFSLVVMARMISLRLTAVSIGPLLIALVAITALRKQLRKRFRAVQEAYAKVSEHTHENLSGIRIVKAYVQEDAEIKRFEDTSLNRYDTMLDYVKLSASFGPVVEVCFGVSFTLVLLIGSSYVSQGLITLGDFVAFNTYLTMLRRPIATIGRIVEVWQSAFASMDRLDDVFVSKTDIVDTPEAIEWGNTVQDKRLRGDITVRNLSFSYPGSKTQALKDISFDLKAGQTLAIIGPTGSGKTTLINLLLRLYPVERGRIFLDGRDINDIPIEVVRENIGCVPQDGFLFSTSIGENIRFYNSSHTQAEVEKAAKMASVYNDVIEFPDGFDTVVGERGITLSGGQKQRVSIARAIIKDPSILILDDSLSAVDTKTEEEILGNVQAVLQNRTGIIIAHRISTIKHADQIIVLDKGQIIEQGSHSELLAKKGYYTRLYNLQLAESDFHKRVDAV